MTTPPLYSFEVYNLNSKFEHEKYTSFLNQIDSHNPFYRIELLNVINDTDGELKYFVFMQDKEPLILMPFYLKNLMNFKKYEGYKDVISPYGYSGPLLKNNLDSKTVIAFWKNVDIWYTKNNVVSEFIRFSLNDNYRNYSGVLVHTLKNIRGRIIEENLQRENHKSNVKTNYKKALGNKLAFKIFHQNIPISRIKEFYTIYIDTMKRNIADKSFYHNIDYFISFINNNPDRCALAMVYKNNIAISTEFVLLSKSTIYSFLGGTNSDYFSVRPNDFLKIEVLSWGRKNGYSFYNLGGGLKDDDNLYNYKKKFFKNDKNLIFYTGRKIVNQNIYEKLVESNVKKNNLSLVDGYFPLYRMSKE